MITDDPNGVRPSDRNTPIRNRKLGLTPLVFGAVVIALAAGHVSNTDAVSAVHGHAIGLPAPINTFSPTLPQGVGQ